MIFRQEFLKKIKAGKVRIAFRRWNKLSVKVGGTLKTSIGVLGFTKVQKISEKSLTDAMARSAGFADLASLKQELDLRPTGVIYRIDFKLLGPDPRLKMRAQTKLTPVDIAQIDLKLSRLDARSSSGPWTLKLLRLLSKSPGVGSKKLAIPMKMEAARLKLNVRKFKNLGLTISLGTGYEISPKGKAYLRMSPMVRSSKY